MTGTLHEDCINLRYYRPECFLKLKKKKNIVNKSCRANKNTQFMFNNFFFSENCTLYEIMWKNVVQPDIQQIALRHITEKMRFACRITDTLISFNTHCFTTAAMVTRTCLSDMLYLHCSSWLFLNSLHCIL